MRVSILRLIFGSTSGRWWRAGKLVGLTCAVAAGVLGAAPAASAASAPSIYWTNFSSGTIGRANLDGTNASQSFITGASEPAAAVLDGSHIYWSNYGSDTIGEANLDGTGVNQSFITGASSPSGLAINGSHIYWTNQNTGTIGEANLDGTGVNQSLISGASQPIGLAINGSHIYWTNYGASTIGEANLDGTGVNQSLVSGANSQGLAVDGAHIYWTNLGGTIGEANLDGTNVNQSLVSGASSPVGMAVSVALGQLSAASLSFPATAQATLSAPQTLTLTNAGQTDLTVGGLSFGGADPGDFLVGSNTCLAPVAPGESCQITVNFAPQGQGARSATLQIATNDVANSPLTVTLSGTGGGLPQGPAGATGPAGPTGATGPRGPAGKVELVTCKTVTKKVHGHRRKLQKCTARLVSKTVKFTAAAANAKLSRAARVVASGVSVTAGDGVTELLLADQKPLRRGGYTLSVRSLHGGRWMVRRTTITIT